MALTTFPLLCHHYYHPSPELSSSCETETLTPPSSFPPIPENHYSIFCLNEYSFERNNSIVCICTVFSLICSSVDIGVASALWLLWMMLLWTWLGAPFYIHILAFLNNFSSLQVAKYNYSCIWTDYKDSWVPPEIC